jgi:hypothetical protein
MQNPNNKLNLETKLNGSNYQLWYFEMAILLESAGCTVLNDAGEPTFLVGSNESETQLVAVKNIALTKHAIVLNCADVIKPHLLLLKNAQEMWHFLFSTYSGENYSRKLQGIKSICAIRYQGGSVPEYIDKALGLLHSTIVASGKDQISLTELCLALVLNGLPNRFSATRSQLESNSANLQLSHVIRSKILEEDERQSLRNNDSSTGGGIALGLNSNRDGRCSHGFPPVNCWKCHPEKHPDNFTCKDCNQRVTAVSFLFAALNTLLKILPSQEGLLELLLEAKVH